MRKTSFVALLVVGAMLVPLAVFASHQFNDVPNSHTFHNAIDWMKDNDITVGCNPPANTEFCPDDNVTRGQMAAFMKRLAENTVVDALTLRGQGALGLPVTGLGYFAGRLHRRGAGGNGQRDCGHQSSLLAGGTTLRWDSRNHLQRRDRSGLQLRRAGLAPIRQFIVQPGH